MLGRIIAAAVLALFAGASSVWAETCGPETPCEVDGGEYRIWTPPGADAAKPIGAIVYFHGYGSRATATMRFKSLMMTAKELGVALIAPDGPKKSWSFPNAPWDRRDELAFMNRVLDDALARFPIDPTRLMSSGFSIGGSMSWYMACYVGERFAGHTPIAGTFWRPHPEACPGPDPFISHVHGTADKTFPLTGRLIRNTLQQGNTHEAVAYFRERDGNVPVIEGYQDGKLDCSNTATADGGAVELCLHDGGHSVRGEWIKRGWMRLAVFKGWTEFQQAAKTSK